MKERDNSSLDKPLLERTVFFSKSFDGSFTVLFLGKTWKEEEFRAKRLQILLLLWLDLLLLHLLLPSKMVVTSRQVKE
jgi:hypothetical protein